MLDDFDFSVLDSPSFKEDAVREEIIAPMLREIGYRPSGQIRVERSKNLIHPFVMIGSKKHRIYIIPDYTLYEDTTPLLVLDAKAPSEPVIRSKNVEQAYCYAIHPEIRCRSYGLCNGRQLVLHDVSRFEPIMLVDCSAIPAHWDEVKKRLDPRFLKMPELQSFLNDFGLMVKKMGIGSTEKVAFDKCFIQMLAKSSDSLFIANSTCSLAGKEYFMTYDFTLPLFETMVAMLPERQEAQIRLAMTRSPFSIETDGKVLLDCLAILGEVVKGQYEDFAPFIVTDVLNVAFNPDATVGWRGPAAIAAGVPVLQA